ncbi:MAG: MsnO8 family LLM class oxidoreductase [Alphaproteobacteria bacterium]|nr:MsnO8 family LLM class oxidoreductase [Alphaproteobacteria bacterium]
MAKFSVLDLSPIVEGGDAASALRNSIDLAKRVERLGYHRIWLAEHHNIPSVASSATAVLLGQIAAATSTIRVGAGGIMLPNHAPLVIAEQFGTLEALFPGRIDLGLGRAPGGDQATAYALRRTLIGGEDRFPQDVLELMAYFAPPEPGQRVVAVPGAGLNLPIWILGSSLFGAQLAAMLGLPFAFASHFAPAQMMEAVALYRRLFKPSDRLAAPYVMLAFNVVSSDTDEEARVQATSLMQAFVNLRRGTPRPLAPPRAGFEATLSPMEKAMMDSVLTCSAIGARDAVARGLQTFVARTGADEVIISSSLFDYRDRVRSFEIAMEAWRAIEAGRADAA